MGCLGDFPFDARPLFRGELLVTRRATTIAPLVKMPIEKKVKKGKVHAPTHTKFNIEPEHDDFHFGNLFFQGCKIAGEPC